MNVSKVGNQIVLLFDCLFCFKVGNQTSSQDPQAVNSRSTFCQPAVSEYKFVHLQH